jgi:hypothetical protein
MLMVLPLLSPTSIDFSYVYGLRQIFFFGSASCGAERLIQNHKDVLSNDRMQDI